LVVGRSLFAVQSETGRAPSLRIACQCGASLV
jgi:hypothetical protein